MERAVHSLWGTSRRRGLRSYSRRIVGTWSSYGSARSHGFSIFGRCGGGALIEYLGRDEYKHTYLQSRTTILHVARAYHTQLNTRYSVVLNIAVLQSH